MDWNYMGAEDTFLYLTADWWTVIVTAILVGITWWYVVITKGILKSNLLAIQQTRDIFKRTNRPYVVIKTILFQEIEETAVLRIEILNSGHMPAEDISIVAMCTYTKLQSDDKPFTINHPPKLMPLLEPQGSSNFALSIDQRMINSILADKFGFEILVDFTYYDEAGEEYRPKPNRRKYIQELNVFATLSPDENA